MMSEAQPDLSGWKPVLSAAVEMAESFPETYRTEVFRFLIEQYSQEPEASPDLGSSTRGPKLPARGGLVAVSKSIGVEPDTLRRVIQLNDEEETVEILAPRIGGKNLSDRQNRYSAVYCFVREKAFGVSKTGIEQLRALCKDRGCYDVDNFTQNFRTRDLLREVSGDDESRQYLLSNEGVEVARDLLQKLANSEL